MKNNHLIFLIILTILSIPKVFSQNYFFDTYSVKEGLAQSKVHYIYQDSLGYLWIGTASGVSKFDGRVFINYTTDDGLAENGVRIIIPGPGGYLWFGHNGGGISRYKDKKFEKIITDSLNPETDITTMLVDHQKHLWIGTHGKGAFCIKNPEMPQVKKFNIEHYAGYNKLSDRIFRMFESHDSNLFIVIDANIIIRDRKTSNFTTYSQPGLSKYFQFTVITEDKDNNIWFGTYNGGLYKLDKKSGKIKTYDTRDGLANNFVTSLYCDKNNNLWAGTWGGGVTLINNRMKIYNTSNGLPDNNIWCITQDHEGNILIGTNENGFCIYKGEQFVSYTTVHGLASDHVLSLMPIDENYLWIGTGKGVNILNKSSGKLETLRYMGYSFDKDVVFLCRDYHNHIWMGTRNEGIYDYSLVSKQIEYKPLLNIYISNLKGYITALETDKHGKQLWVGTIDGLIYYDLTNYQIDRVIGGEISALHYSFDNTLWIGIAGKGITVYKNKEFVRLDTLWNFTAKSFGEDDEQNVWVGTQGQGLKVIKDGKIIRQYKIEDGLLSDYITLVLKDNRGDIWIGSNRGLNRYNSATGRIFTYTQENGFTGIEVKNQAGCVTKDGKIWFGTVKGAIRYNPEAEYIDSTQPLLHFTDFKVNLNSRPIQSGVKLRHTDNAIYISFNNISLTNPELVYYQVMLEGADHDWSQPTRQNYKNYPLLPPGDYVFKVKACNGSGLWSDKPIKLAFHIMPPFYKRWWFIMSCIIIIVAIVVSIVLYRERKLKIEKAILEEKVRERTAEIVKINNELALKNKNITDSIQYARHIQDAILPTQKDIDKFLPNTFILYKPKDIVSGDFYWIESKGHLSMFAVVDCTGHGVPGALMSIIGYNGLNRSVREFGNIKPGLIMDKLNELVQETLKQSENTGIKDGMDMAMCVCNPKTRFVEFAGANNPLYIITNTKNTIADNDIVLQPELVTGDLALYEIKPNRQPIGTYYENVPFSTHSLQLNEDDSLYLFSDGYPDQFGGPNGKKLMYGRFKKLILSIQHLPMNEQKNELDAFIEKWKGDFEQVDDICLMGVKLN